MKGLNMYKWPEVVLLIYLRLNAFVSLFACCLVIGNWLCHLMRNFSNFYAFNFVNLQNRYLADDCMQVDRKN